MYEELDKRLKQIATDLTAGEPSPLPTAREFLSWFGAQRRGYWIVAQLRLKLKEYSLVTEPDFESAYIDSPIAFLLAEESEATAALSEKEASTDSDMAPLDLYVDPTYRVSKLHAANKPLASVPPDASLEAAATIMLANNFSQLPVMTNERDVKGMLSWAGVGSRMAMGMPAGPVRDLMDKYVEVDAAASLFDVINMVAQFDYVLVRAVDRRISGIVTASDLSLQFRQLTEPFLLIGEIENHVRRLIGDRFTEGDLQSSCDPDGPNRVIEGVADMTFGEYIRLLQNPERWAKLGIAIDRAIVVEKLDKIREIRNDVMHFDPDGVPDEDLEVLRDFSQFLQKLQTMGAT